MGIALGRAAVLARSAIGVAALQAALCGYQPGGISVPHRATVRGRHIGTRLDKAGVVANPSKQCGQSRKSALAGFFGM